MKSILVAIDFSDPSDNAASYALHLAKYVKADILLCHAFSVPVEVPTKAFGSWPGYDFTALKEESTGMLEEVANKLRDKVEDFSMPSTFKPEITCLAEFGSAIDVITNVASRGNTSLIVMGMTGASPTSRLLFGSVSRSMINKTSFPLILVPEGFLFNKIKKIGFATSLVDDDIDAIHAIAGFARYFNADLLVSHVWDQNSVDETHKKKLEVFLNDMTCKINYDKLYFRYIEKSDIDKGLDWLTEHGLIDILVMVHRQKGLFYSLCLSHTHVIANRLNVPLFILPVGFCPVF